MPEQPGSWPPGFGETGAERDAILALSRLRTMIPREVHALAWREGSAVGACRAIRRGGGSSGDRALVEDFDPVAFLRTVAATGARAIVPSDEEFPPRLLDLPDPPIGLFVRGRPLDDPRPHVAFVGARACTPYGRAVARGLASGVAAGGAVVVSGAARGVDSAAHRGALAVGGGTVAVLGSGIDVPYPTRNAGLFAEIAGSGTLVSEYAPGTPAEPRHFPQRNRIVASLAHAVVVVEGAEGSGSLITSGFAEDLGRPVLAVPGPIDSELSAAPHQLLLDGAGPATEARDILEAVGLGPPPGTNDMPGGLSEGEIAVYRSLSSSPSTAEAVAAAAGLPPGRALALLAGLELRGLVLSEAGRFTKVLRRERDEARKHELESMRRLQRAKG